MLVFPGKLRTDIDMNEGRGGLVAIIALLLAGLFFGMPSGERNDADRPPASANEPRAATNSDCLSTADEALLRGAARGDAKTIGELKQGAFDAMYPVEFLIATVPDPLDSAVGWQFDERVSAIKQAAEESAHVLDRFWLPWQCGSDKTGGTHRNLPGVLVFRGTYHLLVILLVGETPTWGVQSVAFRQSLDFITRWQAAETKECANWRDRCGRNNDPFQVLDCSKCPKPSKAIRLVGPTYSGAMTSIRQGLQAWRESHCKWSKSLRRVEIVSGSATNRNLRDMLHTTTRPRFRKTVRFRSTILPDFVLLTGFSRYLSDVVKTKNARIAILTESDTAYGQLVAHAVQTPQNNIANTGHTWRILPFPLHIAQLREQPIVPRHRRQMEESLRLQRPRLALPLASFGTPLDALPAIEPRMSGAAAELALSNILSTIEHDGFSYVGLFASDPRDKLFLAEEVKKFAPGVTLFAFESDLLYAHPTYRRATEGMLVVSTYPLFAANQRWTALKDSPSPERLLQMSSDGAQGTYNAVLLQLNEMHKEMTHLKLNPPEVPLLEYTAPFEQSEYPPVWISAVGRGGMWPIWHVKPEELKPPEHVHNLDKATGKSPRSMFREERVRSSAWWMFLLLVGAALSGAVLLCASSADPKRKWMGSISALRPRTCPVCARRQGSYLLLLQVLLAFSVILFYRPYPRFLSSLWSGFLSIALGLISSVPVAFSFVDFRERLLKSEEPCHCEDQSATSDSLARRLTLEWRRWAPRILLVSVAAYLLAIAYILIHEIEAIPTPQQYILFYRAGDLTSGLSPLAPVAFVTIGGVWWCLLNLYRLDLIERAMPSSPEVDKTPARELLDDLRAGLASPMSCAPPLSIAVVMAAVWLVPFLLMIGTLRAVFEGTFLGRYVVWLFVGGYGAILAVSFAHLIFLWRRVDLFLRFLEAGWQREAFARVAKILPSSALRGLWATPFTVASIDNFVRIAEAARREKPFEGRDCRMRRNLETHRTELNSSITKAVEFLRADLHASADQESYWPAFAATDTQDAVTKAAQAANRILDQLGAGDGLDPRIEDRGLDRAETKWVNAMRDLVASQYIAVMAPVLIYMRNLSSFLVGASLLFLLAITSYPVQPSNLLHLHGIIWLLLAIGIATSILIRIKQNDVMQELANKGNPSAGWFDLRTAGSLATYVLLPLIGLIATQLPEFGKALDQLLRIFG